MFYQLYFINIRGSRAGAARGLGAWDGPLYTVICNDNNIHRHTHNNTCLIVQLIMLI